MSNENRKDKIIKDLHEASAPVSASVLAKEYGVSRQIIVGDIAVLRASGHDIAATPRGYIISGKSDTPLYKVACRHSQADIEDELNAIVDCGGSIIDVTVEHPIYGELIGNLQISNRIEAHEFASKLKEDNAPPLSLLTDGVHLHTIACKDDRTFELIRSKLRELGLLFE